MTRPMTGGRASRAFKAWLESNLERVGWSSADLAREARVAPSTISMLRKRTGVPSAKVALLLARALCPPDQKVDFFADQLFRSIGRPIPRSLPEPTHERVLRTKHVNVGYIRYPPFVGEGHERGFATELFDRIASVICQR